MRGSTRGFAVAGVLVAAVVALSGCSSSGSKTKSSSGPAKPASSSAATSAATSAAPSTASSATSSAATGAIDPVFVARANAICAPLVAQGKTLQAQFPVKNFDPRNPKPADLPAVGAYLAKVNAAFTATASKLLQVPPPNGNPAATAELSGLIAKNLANGQAQIAAAQRRDVKAFVAAGAQGKQLVAQIIAASGKLGFTAQSSCVKVFTG